MSIYLKKIQLFISSRRKIVGIATILLLLLIGWNIFGPKKSTQQYQTAVASRGTLITSVSASGQVSVANKASVTTQASGVINEVLVKNGDTVTPGQTITTVTLDQSGQQKQAAAWSTYLSSQNSLNSAQATYYSLQSSLFSKWQAFTTLAENSTYQNSDGSPNTTNRALPQFTTVQNDWLAAEAQDKNQQGVIAQAQASINSAYLSYQAVASTIAAPIAGVVTDLTITPGMQLAGGSTSSTTTNTTTTTTSSGQAIASIKTEGTPIISISISEVDAPQVAGGQRATLIFDALPNLTFTGKIIGINTTGAVSSGVTTYPATMALHSTYDLLLPDMHVTARIITKVDTDVLLVPTAAVTTTSNGSTVQVLKNGKISVVSVEIGDNSDTQTQITSGLSEGDTVVTGITSSASSTTGASSSPFSGIGGRGGFGGGGAVFIRGGSGRGQ